MSSLALTHIKFIISLLSDAKNQTSYLRDGVQKISEHPRIRNGRNTFIIVMGERLKICYKFKIGTS